MDNQISGTARIGANVKLGINNVIKDFVVIEDGVEIGSGNYFAPFSVIGGSSRQRLRTEPWEPTPLVPGGVIIGNNNLFLEHVNVHKALNGDTIIEDDTSIGAYSHIAHDCIVQKGVTCAPGVLLGGFTIIQQFANVGMGATVHQRSVVGAYAMCGMGSVVKGYVWPGTTVAGAPALFIKMNTLGLRRHQFDDAEIEELHRHLLDPGPDGSPAGQLIRAFHNSCSKFKKKDLQLFHIQLTR